jgi:phosphomannomutase
MPGLLGALGCTVIGLNCDVSGVFTRMPEPVPEHLLELGKRVVAERADLGIAVDPDVDRLALVDERGEPFGEEYTITTAVKFVLEACGARNGARRDTVVVNLSTTRAVDDVAAGLGAAVVRTPVGEINVAKKMQETGALIGGEGSGGVILPAVHLGRDAIVGTGLVLGQLAASGGTLSELRASLPRYEMVKAKVALEGRDPEAALRSLAEAHAGSGTVNTDDGVKLMFDDSWVHMRKSNTEPIVRIIAEAPDRGRAEELIRRTAGALLAARGAA